MSKPTLNEELKAVGLYGAKTHPKTKDLAVPGKKWIVTAAGKVLGQFSAQEGWQIVRNWKVLRCS